MPHCNRLGTVTSQPDTSENEIDGSSAPDASKLPPAQTPQSPTVVPTSSRPEIQSSTQSVGTSSRPNVPGQTTSVSYLPPATQTTTSVSYLPPATQTTTSVSYLPPSSTTGSSVTSEPTSESVSYLPPDTGASSTTGSLPSSGKSECTEEGFFPNPDDCRKFYRCVQGQSGYQKFEFQCGPGTAWDQAIQTCNHIGQVTSCSTDSNEIDQGPGRPDISSPSSESPAASISPSATPTESTVTGTPESSTSEADKAETAATPETTSSTSSEKPVPEKPEETQTPESSSESTEQSTSESPSESASSSTESQKPDCATQKPNNTIVCNKEGFYPHPTRCDKFYRCVDNGNGFNVYHFDCPPGTIFDPSISVCNYPESVYPARDCAGVAAAESTTESKAPEQPAPAEVTTAPSATTQQTEEGGVTSTESATTISPEETATPEESTTASAAEATTSEGTEGSTESATEVSSSEQPTETTEESATSSTESTESATESQEQSTTESQEQSSTEPQEQSTTESQESATTETQEQSTTESQEQSTTESEEQSPAESSEPTATGPANAAPCAIGNLTDEQITLVCPTGFRRHPKYCNLFYQCMSEGNMEIKILVLSCPENTIFDEDKIQCLPEESSSQQCMGTKTSARFYRTLEDNALAPVSFEFRKIKIGYYERICKNYKKIIFLLFWGDHPTGKSTVDRAVPQRRTLSLSTRLQQHLLQVQTRHPK